MLHTEKTIAQGTKSSYLTYLSVVHKTNLHNLFGECCGTAFSSKIQNYNTKYPLIRNIPQGKTLEASLLRKKFSRVEENQQSLAIKYKFRFAYSIYESNSRSNLGSIIFKLNSCFDPDYISSKVPLYLYSRMKKINKRRERIHTFL